MKPDGPEEKPFTCPHYRHQSEEFYNICPECGRPFIRDYIDWRMHPRDPKLQGTWYYNPFWARVWLVLNCARADGDGAGCCAGVYPVRQECDCTAKCTDRTR